MFVSSRIKAIGDFIENGDIVVDVGADHGLLELYLIAIYKNVYITAVENKAGPFKILERGLKGVKNVKLSFSDGISAVDEKTKTVVLAGMGGINIKNILDAYPEKVVRLNKIIIDAHRDMDIARKTILDYGFDFAREKIIYEQGKFYIITEFLKADKEVKYNEDDIQIGHKLYKDELWSLYKRYLTQENKKTIEKIKDVSTAQDKVLELKRMNERLAKYGKN